MIYSTLTKQFETARNMFIKLLSTTSAETANVIPNGFNNNIRWNAGHVYTILEYSLFSFTKNDPQIPTNYRELFFLGTKPADWPQEGVPSLEELVGQLEDQRRRVQTTFFPLIEEPLPKTFQLPNGTEFLTYVELLSFLNFHEALHIGYVNALKKAIEGAK